MNSKILIALMVFIVAVSSCNTVKTENETPVRAQPATAANLTVEPTQLPAAGPSKPAASPTTPAVPTQPIPSPAAQTPAAALSPRFPTPDAVAAEQIGRIRQQVAAIRGLAILSAAPTYRVDQRILDEQLLEALAERQTRTEMAGQIQLYQALRLIPAGFDLENNILGQTESALAGLYRVETGEIFLLSSDPSDELDRNEHRTFAHEFSHALANQHFDLAKLEQAAGCPDKPDGCLAFHALIEGEASLSAAQWEAQAWSAAVAPATWRPPAANGAAVDTPAFMLPLFQFPYSYGEIFVRKLYEQGGWPAVNAALAHPPESSEQILHPAKYLAGERPAPVADPHLPQALGSGWTEISGSSLGEWMTYLMLAYSADLEARQPVETARQAAAGWAGDRVDVLQEAQSGKIARAAHWIWDNPADAAEFEQAMRAFIALPQGNTCRLNAGQVECFYADGMESFWLAAPDRKTMERMAEAVGATP